MSSYFLIFSLVFGAAVGAGIVARYLRQPAFLGHVLVGLVIGAFGFLGGGEINRILDVLSSWGIMLLLFLVGLEMNVSDVSRLGGKAIAIALCQIIISTVLFTCILSRIGFNIGSGLFLGGALSFSSTIIVIKLLSEKHDLVSLSGKLAVALLLIQDLVAIVLMIVLTKEGNGNLFGLTLKSVLLVIMTSVVAKRVMPKVLHRLARSVDELILFSLAWCFVIAAIVASPIFGLSLEIGGFLAGVALSGSFEHIHIATKIKPIRDFFLTIFFVGLGVGMKFEWSLILTAVIISLAVLAFKPMIIWLILRLFGYRQRIAFSTGLLFGQVSEFSFILLGLGLRLGWVDTDMVSLVLMIGILTMVVSGYVILNRESIFRILKPILDGIWKDRSGEKALVAEKLWENHIILFGCHRMGKSILMHLLKNREKVVVVDFDPQVVDQLSQKGVEVIYADASDVEVYDRLNLTKARMVISTLRDMKDNLVVLAELKKHKSKVSVVVDAESAEDAKDLYHAGATYVVFPQFVGGLHLGDLVRRGVKEKIDFETYRKYQQEIMAGIYA